MSAVVTADRVAVLVLATLAAVGPTLAARAALVLDPELCVALAWERAGARERTTFAAEPLRVDGRLVPDPWGFPLCWDRDPAPTAGSFGALGPWYYCAVPLATARSYGPDGAPSADDVVVKDAADWPEWQRLAAASPWSLTLLGVVYLAITWPLLRSRPRSGLVDAAMALLVALPLAPVAVTLGATGAMARSTPALPVVIPASFAVPVSLWLLALLLAFAVRVAPRGDTAGA